jgi:hypothetical protein
MEPSRQVAWAVGGGGGYDGGGGRGLSKWMKIQGVCGGVARVWTEEELLTTCNLMMKGVSTAGQVHACPACDTSPSPLTPIRPLYWRGDANASGSNKFPVQSIHQSINRCQRISAAAAGQSSRPTLHQARGSPMSFS